ncbi:MAG: threonine--tRNA ligase [Patescibacteria group bacterium]
MKNIEQIRHSLSHIMAMAVLKKFPSAKLGIGPTIENGFYYDFLLPEKLSDTDLPEIEKTMQELIKQNIEFKKTIVSREDALKKVKALKQNFKEELINDLPKDEKISFYASGDFEDLCAGPHIKNTKEIPIDGFKLTHLAGAYWRGDEKRKMMTRIYGVAFTNKKELDEYLKILEEAKTRDHRKIGKDLDLFIIDPLVGQGLVLWQPKGAMLWRIMEDFWYQEHLKNGYGLVRGPHIGSRGLWETSGHWGFYSNSMYPTLEVGQSLEEAKMGKKNTVKEEYLLKPMNCPFHVMLYKSRPRSYKELPIRWAECGTVYRYEKSGELSGLTRVRGFTQDDAHIICSRDQVKDELKRVAKFIKFIFSSFGFNDYKVYLSLRDPKNKDKYAGNDEGWQFTEAVLEEVAKEEKLDYVKEIGEAAFYGPKLDYKIKDILSREWQCSTLQFDFNLPSRFDLQFVNANGRNEQPYMLHRALFGSFERFIGLLIENYAGAFPLWLSPVQVKILTVGSTHVDFAKKLQTEFLAEGIRVELDDLDETVGNKIRKSSHEKVPYTLVIGDKEMGSENLAIRVRGQKDLLIIDKQKFIDKIKTQIKHRDLNL